MILLLLAAALSQAIPATPESTLNTNEHYGVAAQALLNNRSTREALIGLCQDSQRFDFDGGKKFVLDRELHFRNMDQYSQEITRAMCTAYWQGFHDGLKEPTRKPF